MNSPCIIVHFNAVLMLFLDWKSMAHSVVEYVRNTKKSVVVGRAMEDPLLALDPYILQASGKGRTVKSLLCMPIMKRDGN